MEKETATEAATIEARSGRKAENDANCRLLVKSQSEKQARSEQELGELKAMIAGYEDSYRSAVVEMARVKQAIATESEALQGAEARLPAWEWTTYVRRRSERGGGAAVGGGEREGEGERRPAWGGGAAEARGGGDAADAGGEATGRCEGDWGE